MYLRELTITNYRNIEAASLSFSPFINCFAGDNGMGKTNVLDAIYFLSICRGHSAVRDADNLRHGASCFVIEGDYEFDNGGQHHVFCGYKQGGRKTVKTDGKDVKKLSSHVGQIPLVMISPDDSELITGGSECRRNFMDAVLIQHDAAYLDALIRYERSLKQRNSPLKQEEGFDAGLMDVLEEMMDADAAKIYEAREKFVQDFVPLFLKVYRQLSGVETEEVGIVYESHGSRGPLLKWLQKKKKKECIVGYSLHGPHKDDLLFQLQGHAVKREASQGQQKTFFIALKLAQYLYLKERGEYRTPLLLLDDLFDKLDAGRVECLIRFVSQTDFGQIFITDTSRVHLEDILPKIGRPYFLFDVKNGVVLPQMA